MNPLALTYQTVEGDQILIMFVSYLTQAVLGQHDEIGPEIQQISLDPLA